MLIKMYNKYINLINYFRVKKLSLLGSDIGSQVSTYGRITVMNAKNLCVGNRVTLNEGVHINCRDKVFIGDDVRISTNVQIHTGKLQVQQSLRQHISEPIYIGNNVWIASSCVISAGVTIGDNSVIAAGAVVINDVPANSISGGIPAKVISQLSL